MTDLRQWGLLLGIRFSQSFTPDDVDEVIDKLERWGPAVTFMEMEIVLHVSLDTFSLLEALRVVEDELLRLWLVRQWEIVSIEAEEVKDDA